ncbi:hypothetical protein O181_004335 [Austropuccinia psidii MF-1]|uniref:DNA endonuclease activator Ctp1 C-terminal domain-containing protein n=1 Tax=Austropuccinia psidii MF-1 TaxID=1389203 RepID=A0A9Q3GER9_9BASI|nr:hypothetical protein [Austropuccinia psidii MF-1]
MDEALIQLLGFKDFQAAKNWVIKHGQGRVIPVDNNNDNNSTSNQVMLEVESLRQELQDSKEINQKLQISLIHAQNQVKILQSTLEQELRPTKQSLDSAQRANCQAEEQLSNNDILNENSQSSSFNNLSPLALELLNQHLQLKYDELMQTITIEREKMEAERQGWRKFKQTYAARLLSHEKARNMSTPTPKLLLQPDLKLSKQASKPELPSQNQSVQKPQTLPLSVIPNPLSGDPSSGAPLLEPKSKPILKSPQVNENEPEESRTVRQLDSSKSPLIDISLPKTSHQKELLKTPNSSLRQKSQFAHKQSSSPQRRRPLSRRVNGISPKKPLVHSAISRTKSTPKVNHNANTPLTGTKWIRYSDRKSRKGKSIWKDEDEDCPRHFFSSVPQEEKKAVLRASEHNYCTTAVGPSGQIFETEQDKLALQKSRTESAHIYCPSKNNLRYGSITHRNRDFSEGGGRASKPIDPETTIVEAYKPGDSSRQPKSPSTANLPLRMEHASEGKIQDDSLCSKSFQNTSSRESFKPLAPLPQLPECSKTVSDQSSSCDEDPAPEDFPGQKYMRKIHKRRKKALEQSMLKKICVVSPNQDHVPDINSRLEINPKRNFGVKHVFDEVARGKQIRKQMLGQDCECCAGYYEQAAKDFNQLQPNSKIVKEHRNQISRHRHFNPPPQTPPCYWQLGFPDTQQVEEINKQAEENKRLKLAKLEAQAKEGIGAYKLKKSHT